MREGKAHDFRFHGFFIRKLSKRGTKIISLQTIDPYLFVSLLELSGFYWLIKGAKQKQLGF